MKLARKAKKFLSILLTLVMITATWIGIGTYPTAEAAAKPKLNKSSINIKVGKSKKLKLKKKIRGAKIKWKSNNAKIAKVNNKGKVTGMKKGNTKIIARVSVRAKKYRLSCKVKVTKVTKQVSETPAPLVTPVSSLSPTPSPAVTPSASVNSPTPSSSPELLFAYDFESGTDGFGGRNATVSRVNTAAYSGNYSLFVTGRSSTWNGVQMDSSNFMEMGNKYFVSGYVKQDTGSDQTIKMSLEYSFEGGGNSWPSIGEQVCKSGEWTLIEGYVAIETAPSMIRLYFEVPSSSTAEFYVDKVSCWWDSEVEIDFNPPNGSLSEAYKDLFTIGTAITAAQLTNASEQDKLDHVLEQYTSITMENEMKPDYVLRSRPIFEDASFDRSTLPEDYTDEQVPNLNFATIDSCLAAAQENNLKMRGHTLIWHSQTPAWFFKEDYSTNQSANFVSKSVMNARMEFYIKTVLEYVQTNYPGVIYAWDVCNEVFTNDGVLPYENALRGGNPDASETSNWYRIYQSDEFVINAFTYAKRYKEDGVSLFYNDYNEYMPDKTDNIVTLATKLHDLDLIDGIGMQSHIDLSYPSVEEVKTAIDRFAAIGDGALEIQLTELDVTMNFNEATGGTFELQTEYYSELMKMLVRAKRDEGINITNVTFWGFYDEMSWRSSNTPLLLNYIPSLGFTQKGAFASVLNAPTEA
ncbi:MAG: endo-1,4-beta-xylanase [Lachnoclostridium sp.]|jgi:endo-1,4-beta-xylanase|nr:endo-1,4-beta-xylanase [Lachnoclostridium sp.]